MTGISEDQMEYAVVDRCRKLLERRQVGFEITHPFSHFSSILLWVMQRSRRRVMGKNDYEISLMELWENRSIDDIFEEDQAPNIISIRVERVNKEIARIEEAEKIDMSQEKFFLGLRDCFAHGDYRTVKPWSSKYSQLIGYHFICSDINGKKYPDFKSSLTGEHMTILGKRLADDFCILMREHALEKGPKEKAA